MIGGSSPVKTETPSDWIVVVVVVVFFDEAQRRMRRGSVTTREPHQYKCVYVNEGKLIQSNKTFHTRARVS